MSSKNNITSWFNEIRTLAFNTGAMIGSGIFFLPYSLSTNGCSIGLLSIFLVSILYAFFAYILSKIGNPFTYIQENLGRNFSILISYGYWVISWATTILVINQITVYLIQVFPIIGSNPFIFKSILLSVFVILNFFNIRNLVLIEILLTSLKVLILISVPLVFLLFHKMNFKNIAIQSFKMSSIFNNLLTASWAYVGIECMSISTDIKKKNIVVPVILAAFIYISNILTIFLTSNTITMSPFASIFQSMYGKQGLYLISILIGILGIGTLNTWITTSTYCGYENSKNNLFPKFFSKTNRFGAPYWSVILSNIFLYPMFLFGNNLSTLVDFSTIGFILFYMIISGLYTYKNKSILSLILFIIFGSIFVTFLINI